MVMYPDLPRAFEKIKERSHFRRMWGASLGSSACDRLRHVRPSLRHESSGTPPYYPAISYLPSLRWLQLSQHCHHGASACMQGSLQGNQTSGSPQQNFYTVFFFINDWIKTQPNITKITVLQRAELGHQNGFSYLRFDTVLGGLLENERALAEKDHPFVDDIIWLFFVLSLPLYLSFIT